MIAAIDRCACTAYRARARLYLWCFHCDRNVNEPWCYAMGEQRQACRIARIPCEFVEMQPKKSYNWIKYYIKIIFNLLVSALNASAAVAEVTAFDVFNLQAATIYRCTALHCVAHLGRDFCIGDGFFFVCLRVYLYFIRVYVHLVRDRFVNTRSSSSLLPFHPWRCFIRVAAIMHDHNVFGIFRHQKLLAIFDVAIIASCLFFDKSPIFISSLSFALKTQRNYLLGVCYITSTRRTLRMRFWNYSLLRLNAETCNAVLPRQFHRVYEMT